MGNIFAILIATLDSIPVSGEQNHRKMIAVMDVLHKMERSANEEEEKDGTG